MKKLSKILALLLATAMCLMLLAACAKDEAADDQDPSDNQNTEESGETENTEEPGEEGYAEEDIVEITVYGLSVAPEERVEAVEAAINDITEQKIGIHGCHDRFIEILLCPCKTTEKHYRFRCTECDKVSETLSENLSGELEYLQGHPVTVLCCLIDILGSDIVKASEG